MAVLMVGFLAFVIFGIANMPPAKVRTPEELAALEADRKSAAAAALAEREAESQRIAAKQAEDMAALEPAMQKLSLGFIESYQVRKDKLTITVAQEWHTEPYQYRLQAAQIFHALWVKTHNPSDAFNCFMSIVDVNGNEVGGYGLTGVWVQKQ